MKLIGKEIITHTYEYVDVDINGTWETFRKDAIGNWEQEKGNGWAPIYDDRLVKELNEL